MPSPVGHALAGVAVALAGNRPTARLTVRQFLSDPLTLWSVALATLPDADLLLPGFHRTVTHSVTATIVVTIVAIAVTGQVTKTGLGTRGSGLGGSEDSGLGTGSSGLGARGSGLGTRVSGLGRISWGVVLTCAAAHLSHLALDWLGSDRSHPAGTQMLWPWSDRWFISGWDLFPQTERSRMLSAASMAINIHALVWELLLMGPIVVVLWWRRLRRSTQSSQRG